jgi:ribosomal protein S18 acetylase RimI-like enzyme
MAAAADTPLTIKPLTEETWDALAAFFREGSGDPRWCWCQFWRLRSKDMAPLKVPELRERLHDQAASDQPPGLVAFEGERALGWVSVAPRTDYQRVVYSKVIPKVDDRPVWSIVCFAVSSIARRRGIAKALLNEAVAFARSRGATAVEAYPLALEPGQKISASSVYTGTLSMFEKAGFDVVADRASDPSSKVRRVVVRREL